MKVCVWAQVWHFVLFLFDLFPRSFHGYLVSLLFWKGGDERGRGENWSNFLSVFRKSRFGKVMQAGKRWKLNISEAEEKNNGIAVLWQGHRHQYHNYPFDLFFSLPRFHKKNKKGAGDEMEKKKSWKWKRIARQHRGSAKNEEKGKELATTAIKI